MYNKPSTPSTLLSHKPGHIRINKNATSTKASYKEFCSIKKQADDTLTAFQNEYIKQSNVVDAMRQELKRLTKSNIASRQMSPIMIVNSRPEREEELSEIKKKLSEKEWALKNEALNNRMLREENEKIRKENKQSIALVKQRLEQMLERYGEPLRNEERVERLLDRIEDLIETLINKYKTTGSKYDNLLEMYNKLLFKGKTQRNKLEEIINSSKSITVKIKDKPYKKLTLKNQNNLFEETNQCRVESPSAADTEKNLKARIARLDTSLKVLTRTRNVNESNVKSKCSFRGCVFDREESL